MPMFSQGIVTPVGKEHWLLKETFIEFWILILQLKFHESSPGTGPRCLRMDPELLGRTVRFHPCLREREDNKL